MTVDADKIASSPGSVNAAMKYLVIVTSVNRAKVQRLGSPAWLTKGYQCGCKDLSTNQQELACDGGPEGHALWLNAQIKPKTAHKVNTNHDGDPHGSTPKPKKTK